MREDDLMKEEEHEENEENFFILDFNFSNKMSMKSFLKELPQKKKYYQMSKEKWNKLIDENQPLSVTNDEGESENCHFQRYSKDTSDYYVSKPIGDDSENEETCDNYRIQDFVSVVNCNEKKKESLITEVFLKSLPDLTLENRALSKAILEQMPDRKFKSIYSVLPNIARESDTIMTNIEQTTLNIIDNNDSCFRDDNRKRTHSTSKTSSSHKIRRVKFEK
ncbi:hypothetical protein SNEBB_008766 [Seison nebaliae]|nr:hypothetical protein SNEBB_008766 [Seison nebaliae]